LILSSRLLQLLLVPLTKQRTLLLYRAPTTFTLVETIPKHGQRTFSSGEVVTSKHTPSSQPPNHSQLGGWGHIHLELNSELLDAWGLFATHPMMHDA